MRKHFVVDSGGGGDDDDELASCNWMLTVQTAGVAGDTNSAVAVAAWRKDCYCSDYCCRDGAGYPAQIQRRNLVGDKCHHSNGGGYFVDVDCENAVGSTH